MEEIAYNKGSENSLQYSRDFYLRFKCQFELQYYPFDTQICTILLKKPPEDRKFLRLMAKQLNYSGPLGLAEFVISSFDIVAEPGNIHSDIQV